MDLGQKKSELRPRKVWVETRNPGWQADTADQGGNERITADPSPECRASGFTGSAETGRPAARVVAGRPLPRGPKPILARRATLAARPPPLRPAPFRLDLQPGLEQLLQERLVFRPGGGGDTLYASGQQEKLRRDFNDLKISS